MNGVRFTIPGEPVGKGRPRFYQGHAVTPKKTREQEKLIKQMYLAQANGRAWMNGEPLEVFVRFYYPVPKSYTKKRRAAIENFEELPTKKPDIDNCLKLLLDACNGVAWADDTQVISVTADKFYADDVPYTFVSISEIDKEEAEARKNGTQEDV